MAEAEAVAVAVAEAVAVAVAEAVAVAVAEAVAVAVAEAVAVAVAEAVAVAVPEAVEDPVSVDVALEVEELVVELLTEADTSGLIEPEIEGDEDELSDGKVEGLSDCFCAAEGELDCDTDCE